MSTAEQLLNADMKEAASRKRRYMKSSSLTMMEKVAEFPTTKKSPRDRVLKKILSMKLEAIVRELCGDEVAKSTRAAGIKVKE